MKGTEITYGSYIILKSPESSYMVGRGFIDRSVYISQESDFEFASSIFQILPKCIYNTQQSVLKNISDQTSEEVTANILKKVDSLEGEFKTNIQNYDLLMGSPIHYGAQVQLLHVCSSKYLTLIPYQTADVEHENLMISLQDYGYEASHFRIQASFNYQVSTNGVVKCEDKVYFQGYHSKMSRNIYLHASEFTYRIQNECKKAVDIYELNASLDTWTNWKILLFSEAEGFSNALLYGDALWLRLSVESLAMSVKYNPLDADNEATIQLMTNLTGLNGLWLLEQLDMSCYGKVYISHNIRIKHLSTGKYLSITKIPQQLEDTDLLYEYSLSLTDHNDPHNIWKLIPIPDSEDAIAYDKDYYVLYNISVDKLISSYKDDTYMQSTTLELQEKSSQDHNSVFMINKADKYVVSNALLLRDCFFILRSFPDSYSTYKSYISPSSSEIKNFDKTMNITLDTINLLDSYCQNKVPSMISLDKQYGEVQIYRQNLLKEFCFIEILVLILDGLFREENVRLSVTNLVRKQTVDIRMEYSDEDSVVFDEDFVGKGYIIRRYRKSFLNFTTEIGQKIYKLLEIICKNNPKNQQLAFEHFGAFMKHAVLGIGATECMLSIISDNESLLYSIVKVQDSLDTSESIIPYIIRLLNQYHFKKMHDLLKFLSRICSYKGEGLTANQLKIFEILIKDTDNFEKILLPMNIYSRPVLYPEANPNSPLFLEEVDLKLFFKKNLAGSTQSMQYMQSQLRLFADLCMGRNIVCMDVMKKWFTIDQLVDNLFRKKLPITLRAVLAQLISNIYIDTYPRFEIEKPELIKNLKLSLRKKAYPYNDVYCISESGNAESYLINLITKVYTEFSKPSARVNQTALKKVNLSLPNKDIVKVSENELPIYILSDTIIDYLSEPDTQFNVFTYEIIKIVKKMIQFEIYGVNCVSLHNKKSFLKSQFSTKAMGIIRISKVLIQLSLSTYLIERTAPIKAPFINPRKDTQKIFDSARKDSSYSYNSIFASALNLRNYLHSLSYKLQEEDTDISYPNKCKEEILSVINLYLNWRIEFLIYNIIEWFNHKDTTDEIKDSELIQLLPPIVPKGRKLQDLEIFEETRLDHEHRFKSLYYPEIPDLSKVCDSPVVPLLINSFVLNHDPHIQSQFLKIILRCHNQRSELIEAIQKLYIITDKKGADLYAWTKLNSIRFKDLCCASEIWISAWNSENIQSKESLMFEASLEMIKIFRSLLRKDSWIVDGQPKLGNGKVSSKRQLLLFYIGLHKSIVQLIKDGMQELKILHDKIQDEIYTTKLHSLFENCFLLLSEMTCFNSKIQKEMRNYIPLVISYLRVDVKQIDFYSSIYKNNLLLCSSIKDAELLTYYNAISREGKQSRFFKFFETIMFVNDISLPAVQTQVLNLFISQNTDFLEYLSKESGKFSKKNISKAAALIKRSFFSDNQPVSYYEYHASLIHLLSMCCYGVNKLSLNEAKSQKIIKIKYLFYLLEECENSSSILRILRIPLLEFLYNVYIDVEKKYESLKSHPYLLKYIDTRRKYLVSCECISQDYAEFLDHWLEILNAYIDSFVIKEDIKYSNEDYIAIREYIYHLNDKLHTFPFHLTAKSRKLLNRLLMYFNIDVPSGYSDSFISDSDSSCSDSSETDQNELIKRWEEVRTRYSTISGDIWQVVLQERQDLKYIIYHLGEYTESLTFESFLRTLVNFLRHSKSQNLPNEIIIKTLRLLSDLVSKPLTRINETCDQAKARVQSLLESYGAGNVTLSLLCTADIDPELFEACVMLAVDLLEGGNLHLQREFYQFFINVSASEILLSKIHETLLLHIEKTLETFDNDPEQILLYRQNQILICSIIRFLQLLCENHNIELQNYLRYQDKSTINYNMLLTTINLLGALMYANRGSSFLVINQCFDTITEFMQGPCAENQKEVLDSKFLDITSPLLGVGNELSHRYSELYRARTQLKKAAQYTSDVLETPMIHQLKYKTLITLHALIEGRTDDLIIGRVIRAYSIDIFKENLVTIYQSYKRTYGGKYYEYGIFNNYIPTQILRDARDTSQIQFNTKPIIEIGFLIYFLIKHFQSNEDPEVQEMLQNLLPDINPRKERATDLGVSFRQSYNKMTSSLTGSRRMTIMNETNTEKLMKETIEFFENHTGHIEVVLRNGNLIRVYFPLSPSYFSLTPQIQHKFMNQADRTTFRTKLQYLMKKTPRYIEEIRHEHRLNQLFNNSKVFNFIANKNKLWQDLAFINCLLINFLILASYSSYGTNRINGPSLLYNRSGNDYGLSVEDTIILLNILGALQCVFAFMIVIFYLIKAVPVEGKRGWNKVSVHRGHTKQPLLALIIQQIIRLLIAIKYVLNPNVVFYVLYMIMAILGLGVHPFFFATHLFEILYRFPVLQNVVKSVSVPRKALFLTFLLMIVAVYIFGLLGYYWIYRYFKGMCPDLWICFLTVFDRGFKASGGIGGWFDNSCQCEDGGSDCEECKEDKTLLIPAGEVKAGRFFYDNLYNIIVIIMLLNIVQGIIIDTFVVLRLKSEADEKDKKNVCFICNIDRDSMESRTNESFFNHRLHDHNEWSYIFYLDYILSKNPVDYTGIESYVRNMYNKIDIYWFPHKRALALEETFESDDDAMKQRQNDVEIKLEELEKIVDDLLK